MVPNDSAELVQAVLVNRRKLDELDDQRSALTEWERVEFSRITYDVYRPQITALKAKRDQEIEAVQAETKSKQDEISRQATELMQVHHRVKRILEFLKLDTAQSLDLSDVQAYRDRYLEDLGFIIDDKYLKIKLYIVGNSKPTNKFSLGAGGRCLFSEDMLKLQSYGLDLTYRNRLSLEVAFKDGPTIAGLKEYLAKHRSRLLAVELQKYVEVKAEYEQAVGQYKLDDFAALITDKCPKCGVSLTVFDSWSRNRDGTVTCWKDQTPMERVVKD